MRTALRISICIVAFVAAFWAVAQASPRESYFDRPALVAERRGDRTVAGFLRGPAQAPPTVEFSAAPQVIDLGDTTVLTWEVSGAETVRLNGGPVEPTGRMTLFPSRTSDYELVAQRGEISTRMSVQVRVTEPPPYVPPPPHLDVSLSPQRLGKGETAILEWEASNAADVSVNGVRTVRTGRFAVTPVQSERYTFVAKGPGGTTRKSVHIHVHTDEPQPPMAAIKTIPHTVSPGETFLLAWRTFRADSVTINGKPVPLEGRHIYRPSSSMTFDLTAYGPGGHTINSTALFLAKRN